MRILEFGDNKAAGYAGRLFQQYGAEVIRVDLPTSASREASDQALDIYLHTEKKRVSIDYRSEHGRELLRRIADESDIVISDCLPVALDELNWSQFDRMRVSITPFGLDGPYRDWQGFGPILQAMGGYAYIIGDPIQAPLSIPMHYAEYQAGQFAYTAALASFISASPSANIEVSMLETVMTLSQWSTIYWTMQQKIRKRQGNRMGNVHPVSLYRCKDGFVYLTIVPTFWRNLVAMIDRPELLDDERFATATTRLDNMDALDEILNESFLDLTMAECLELGQRKYRLPIGTAMTLDQVLNNEHLEARHYWQNVNVPGHGQIRMPGAAFRKTPAIAQPDLTYAGGEHG
ncbi:MAG: CoA transferase [Pseudomonadota bacterium]